MHSNHVACPASALEAVPSVPGGNGRPRAQHAPATHTSRRRPSPTPHLTPDEYVRLLAHVDDQGVTTLDAVSRALPRVSQPISAVFDLCDAGILNVDWEAALDGDMHLWRVDR